jgi:hypothetical protein
MFLMNIFLPVHILLSALLYWNFQFKDLFMVVVVGNLQIFKHFQIYNERVH